MILRCMLTDGHVWHNEIVEEDIKTVFPQLRSLEDDGEDVEEDAADAGEAQSECDVSSSSHGSGGE